jgi:hypothetical protein
MTIPVPTLLLMNEKKHTFDHLLEVADVQQCLQELKLLHANDAILVKEFGIVAPTGPAGAVTFFDCNVMHGSKF